MKTSSTGANGQTGCKVPNDNSPTSRTLANRQNAAQSTGPRSPAGKAGSSMNALQYGLRSSKWLLPTEDPNELGALRKELVDDIRPKGKLQELLVERLLFLFWRLQRTSKAEADILQIKWWHAIQECATVEANKHIKYEDPFADRHLELIEVLDENANQLALDKAKAAAAMTMSEQMAFGLAFRTEETRKNESLDTVLRYSISTERSIFKVIHEIRRQQAWCEYPVRHQMADRPSSANGFVRQKKADRVLIS